MTNVIQFPGKKGQPAATPPNSPSPKKPKAKQKVMAGAVLAIILATVATNRAVYSQKSMELSSQSGRAIASVQGTLEARDSNWERSVADALASAEVRGPASINIGRDVSALEQLQLGTLRGVYSLQFSEEGHQLRAITLQGSDSSPAYVSPEQFFKKYGQLINPRFKQALALREPVRADGHISESFQVLDVDNRPVGEAHFEMDRHGRLLSFQVSSKDQL